MIGSGKKKIKNQFVIVIGDDGAILCHYINNTLSSRVFVDSPASEDVKLFEKLLSSYPTHPLTLLVDVMEQSYSQQVLPPVSSIGLVSQIERRMKRDLREEDLNNFIISGRSQDGRKDWNVLFISLANTEPFSMWLEFVLQQKNKFGGIFLLPVESVRLVQDLKVRLSDAPPPEWEIMLLHNKTGGFRIITFRNDKLVFARLAQNLIGENITEVVVGNLEQELQNTFEYLKRLGFRGDTTSKLTVVASSDILEKLDTKILKFSEINLFSPFQIAEVIGLPETVNPKDKYADVFMASHFAAQRKHSLKFHTRQTKVLDYFYLAAKGLLALLLLVVLLGIGYEGHKIHKALGVYKELEVVRSEFKMQSGYLNQGKDQLRKVETPDSAKIVSIYNLYKLLPTEKYRLLNVLSKISPEFGQDKLITSINFRNDNWQTLESSTSTLVGTSTSKKVAKRPTAAKKATAVDLASYKKGADYYNIIVAFEFLIPESKGKQVGTVANAFLKKMEKLLPDMKIVYTKPPVARAEQEFEFLAERLETKVDKVTKFPAEIRITPANQVEPKK